MRFLPVSLALLALAPSVATAKQIEVSLKSTAGAPVADAVVTFTPAAGASGRAARVAGPYVMAQQNISFAPRVLVAPVGAVVSFPNKDKVRHHVYSFSGAKRFELKLYGREETRTVTFDKPGVVAVGCNIHDRMSGFIVVVDAPFAAKSDASGKVLLSEVPDGPGVLTVWQPDVTSAKKVAVRHILVSGFTRLAYTLDLKPPPSMQMPMH